MWAAPMLTPSLRGLVPTTASIKALPRLIRYSLSPGLTAMPRVKGLKPLASARRTASVTHSRSVLPASKNFL